MITLPPLHLITAGSVDDGKSTLIGRLLLDTQSLFSDQVASLWRVSAKANEDLNLALITDGLRAERRGGITIDVGYRYFETRNRKVILADTPGHIEFTPNMVTAASNAEAALILVDATKRSSEQTNRHIILANLLGVRQFMICINKIDLEGYSKSRFDERCAQLLPLVTSFPDSTFHFVPTSALLGDNIASRSEKMSWYDGPTVLDFIETVPLRKNEARETCFSVRWVIDNNGGKKMFGGEMLCGRVRVGDTVTHLPSMQQTIISSISRNRDILADVSSPLSAVIEVEGDARISRGHVLVRDFTSMDLSKRFRATVCWLGDQAMQIGKSYVLQHHTRSVSCIPVKTRETLDVMSNAWQRTTKPQLVLNEIGNVEIEIDEPLLLRTYTEQASLGSAIMIDPLSNDTVGAVLVTEVHV